MKYRVVEIGTYWKEFEVEAENRDKAIEIASNGDAKLIREGKDCDQFETEALD